MYFKFHLNFYTLPGEEGGVGIRSGGGGGVTTSFWFLLNWAYNIWANSKPYARKKIRKFWDQWHTSLKWKVIFHVFIYKFLVYLVIHSS
jgi:hypothetical protein